VPQQRHSICDKGQSKQVFPLAQNTFSNFNHRPSINFFQSVSEKITDKIYRNKVSSHSVDKKMLSMQRLKTRDRQVDRVCTVDKSLPKENKRTMQEPITFKVEIKKDEVPGNELINDAISTAEFKKHVILRMLKDSKIPEEIVVTQEKNMGETKEWRLEELAEGILASYDVIIQPDCSYKPLQRANFKKPKKVISIPKKLIPIKVTTDKEVMAKKSLPKVVTVRTSKKVLKNLNEEIRINNVNLPKGVKDSHINRIIHSINKYTYMVFRTKEHHYDLKAINALHKKLNLGKLFRSEEDMKSRERVCKIKESLLRLLYSTLNRENGYMAVNTNTPKYFIGRGNNAPLVKSLMRDKWWWGQAEEFNTSNNFLWTQWIRTQFVNSLGSIKEPIEESSPRISNHLEGNIYIGFKKYMYKSLSLYYSLIGKDTADVIPLTFHITQGKTDLEYTEFKKAYLKYEAAAKIEEVSKEVSEESEEEWSEAEDSTTETTTNIWILKPGENTNRGNGIKVVNKLPKIEQYISDKSHTYIIQKYIEHPLLFKGRKFDIRCFALITSINGYIKAYYYQEGYLRTSSKDYSVDDFSKSVHLTNEAVQIRYDDFGKHEAGNKISYAEFKKYVEDKKQVDFNKDVLGRIKVLLYLLIGRVL